MAQYYQVLSQGDKPNMENLRQFYPNIVENQGVQYVISHDAQPAFQDEEVLVASEKYIVVENSPQSRIVVDPGHYKNQQYVIQETLNETTRTTYLMEETKQATDATVAKSVQQSIVVAPDLNLRSSISTNISKIVNATRKPQMSAKNIQSPIVRSNNQSRQVRTSTPNKRSNNARTAKPTQNCHVASVSSSTSELDMSESDNCETVSMLDGSFMSLNDYKHVTERKKRQRNRNTGGARGRSNTPKTQAKATFTKTMQYPRANLISTIDTAIPDEAPNLPGFVQVSSHQPTVLQPAHAPIQQPQPSITQTQHISQNQFIITPPRQHPQTTHPLTLPPNFPTSQLQELIENSQVNHDDSIRMLVFLACGEQRLITFTLPREQCTIQEILEQVGITVTTNTKIDCTEVNINGINYIVTVGMQTQYCSQEVQVSEEAAATTDETVPRPEPRIEKPASPEPPKELPRFVPGRLAVCMHCGYLSEDFNKCLRCKRKLPEDVKSIVAPNAVSKTAKVQKNVSPKAASSVGVKLGTALPTAATGTLQVNATKKKTTKSKLVESEPIILTLSSDDEDDNQISSTEHLERRIRDPVVDLSATRKEPSVSDIEQTNSEIAPENFKGSEAEDSSDLKIEITCRTIRVGSYRFIPADNFVFSGSSALFKAPRPGDPGESKVIVLDRMNVVKVLVNFQKMLPVIFYYVKPSVGEAIRQQLGMVDGSEIYFDPLSREEAYKRITILPEVISEEAKHMIRQIYGKPFNIIDELTNKEANNILMKTCPKEVSKVITRQQASFAEIKQLLIYPPGKGGLSINTEDYLCLALDQFLNDVIIDFYLKYLVLHLTPEKQEKVHVFSTFFYKRLTTKPSKVSRKSHPTEVDPNLNPAEKRHARVKNWTKNVNLFDKDFIIVPINEHSHWFLAIICFPDLNGCFTNEGLPGKQTLKKKKKIVEAADNVAINQIKLERENSISCEDSEISSDKDEAEGDESELDSGDESEDTTGSDRSKERAPIKQPCILIFDSLAGVSRSRVVATLRDYLTVEYKAKMGVEKQFNKDVIKGACPKVPQQTNFTDCGLYLLQYVESFFTNPIRDYHIPIKELKNWFEEITVTKKREDIANLIKELMVIYKKDTASLPDMQLPTYDGKLIVRTLKEDDDDDEEEPFDEEMEDEANSSFSEAQPNSEDMSGDSSIEREEDTSSKSDYLDFFDANLKPTEENVKSTDGFIEHPIMNPGALKPDVSEVQKQSSRETLSYLKAKRIIRHKNHDGEMEPKKFKAN